MRDKRAFIRAVGFNTPPLCGVTEGIKPEVQLSGRTKIKRRSAAGIFISIAVFICLQISLAAQNEQGRRSSAPYQIPAVIYAGDAGKLVYPISQFSNITKDTKVSLEENADDQSADAQLELFPDIVIKNIDLDKDLKNLVIDFQAYRTGKITLPTIIVGVEKLDSLQVQIASLLDSGSSAMALSPPAAPLAARGTFWIITSIVLFVIVVLLLLYLFWKKGRGLLSFLNFNLRSYFLLKVIFNTIKKIQKMLSKEKIMPLVAVSNLSYELRKFFSALWNTQCMSMVPEEFLTIQFTSAKRNLSRISSSETAVDESAVLYESGLKIQLCNFFKMCDSIRFSGEVITSESANEIIQKAKNILNGIYANRN
ncbi:MAG: hypothetical protein Ta2B_28880 [Termitinemataceae bacterium]|nr:MAG: hypothetical protein Ta2B_28880 [Termitinemataceae bacterium]